MSLAQTIAAEQVARERVKCKTCITLAALTDDDRADFAAAKSVPGSVLAAALATRYTEVTGEPFKLDPGSVRTHIREGHGR